MAYSHLTWTQTQAQLSARLHDSSNLFFTNTGTWPEVTGYLQEALRVWQVLTGYWRDRETFDTVASTAFYDLEAKIATSRDFTITDRVLVAEMQYHTLEPATPTAWSGTEMFTLAEFTAALQRRRDQFLVETGCFLTRATQAVSGSPPASRQSLPATTIDVRRVVWYDATPTYTHLWREDEWALTSYTATWDSTTATPYAYSLTSPPPLTIELAPSPSAAGNLEIFSVRTGATLNPATPVKVGIPDDFCWIVKWGALADLLSKDGPARDPARAAYCEQRYRQGVELARHAVCIVQADLDGTKMQVVSVQELDAYAANWQNTTAAEPTVMASLGLNYVGFYPTPDGVYTVTVDVVENAPIPASGDAAIQIGGEELDAIIGYAEHIAMFKVGGPEFEATNTLLENFLNAAMVYGERLGATARYLQPMRDQSSREDFTRPRRKKIA